MSEAPTSAPDRSPVRIGAFMTLAGLGFAALIGIIAVVDADGTGSSVAIGAGIAATVFVAGGTIACAFGCLARRRNELLALGGLAASVLTVDLFVLAIWREIDDETYAKIAAISFVWTFFGLLILGLTLAVEARHPIARVLYLGAMIATCAAGLITTWLIATSGDAIAPLSPLGFESLSDETLLRPLAAALVLLSTLWFGALAASRLDQASTR